MPPRHKVKKTIYLPPQQVARNVFSTPHPAANPEGSDLWTVVSHAGRYLLGRILGRVQDAAGPLQGKAEL